MLQLGMANFMMFFVIIVIGLIFVVAWIVKSEKRIEQAKQEITKLGEEIESYQREKVTLSDKISALENAKPGPEVPPGVPEAVMQEMSGKNEALEKDNKQLKKELSEAKASLEEVYKALSSQSEAG